MRALTVETGRPDSLAMTEVPDPVAGPGELLVEGLAVGVCATDREIIAAEYGEAPPGEHRLVIGHESLGRVVSAPDDSDFASGDHVVGVVRRPDPEPCGACARGLFDMCRNGRYTERGIKGVDGFASQRWTVPTEYAVKCRRGLANSLFSSNPRRCWRKRGTRSTPWEIDRGSPQKRSWSPVPAPSVSWAR